jgi:hypothetical protein
MATRMQQRRGTAAQWISTNSGNGPILEVGEIGFETDTGKFKIGDGTSPWTSLSYFADVATLGTALDGDFLELTDIGIASGVAGLDASKNLLVPGASIIVEGATDNTFETTLTVTDPTADRTITFPDTTGTVVLDTTLDEMAQDAVNTAIVAGTGLDKTYDDGANTITLDIDSTVVTLTGSQTLTNKTITSPSGLVKGDVGLGNVDNTSDANKPVSTATQTALDLKANLASPTFTGTTTTDDLVVDGDFTVNGTNFAASATSIVIEDNLVQIAHQNPANTVDLGLVVGYNDGTAKHAGIVRDTSANKWKIFKGVTTEPATTVDFTQGSLDDLEVAGFTASSITIGDVSNTEFGYLNGVTSAIQTQIDSKLDSSTASSTYAPLASPTFTGTVTLPTGTVTSTMISDGTIVNADINASAAIDKTKISGTAITASDTGTVTNTMLAGSIANDKLSNSSITINGSTVSLGGSTTIQAGPDEIMVLMGAL